MPQISHCNDADTTVVASPSVHLRPSPFKPASSSFPFLACLTAIPLLVLVAASCSSSVEPRSGVTLLIKNASCTPGPCSTQEVLAFPINQPHTPGGLWSLDLGTMAGPQLCVVIPTSSTFSVIGPAETTKFVWNTAKPMSLGVKPESASYVDASPSTSEFVPATAAGWSITLPGGAQAVQDTACTL